MIVLTLLVRDEADIVEANILFHLEAGVDHVIATDHRSVDGTREILARFEREGVLRLLLEDDPELDARRLRTEMARLAATEFGASWVIGADADEFFWPCGESLPSVLAAVPAEFGVVEAPWRFFVPRPGDEPDFSERMLVCLSPDAWLSHPGSIYKPDTKIVHRGDSGVVIQGGNHCVLSVGLDPMPLWHPIEVMHFPIRSAAQLERKMVNWSGAGRAWTFDRPGITDAHEWFASLSASDEVVEAGTQSGVLTTDTRLRDLLRAARGRRRLRGSRSTPSTPGQARPDLRSLVPLWSSLGDRSFHRLQRRLDDLGSRIGAEETRRVGAGRSARLRPR